MARYHGSRHPQIGDLLFVTCRNTDYHSRCVCHTAGEKHVGIVREFEHDSYGHQRHVLIEWSSKPPINYREEYGYSGVNIHNLRDEFEIIREGIRVEG